MTKLLLDTHVFIWWISGNELLGENAREMIANPVNEVYVSAATVWEMSIKKQLGKLEAPDDIEQVVTQSGFLPLPISMFHAQQAGTLPTHHKDPFDRMLIAQAQADGLVVVTKDEFFPHYGIRLLDATK
ncbi:MAG: type II toxin-antitoxin system VapC family toxin [Saccharospirillaceae bacterium]|nr:type II toxin-antitoxin system VapC family toxin [Pseudomonadales bacterium]NRB80878.1 type II toxin-antitoxin system VapC family toxin [Saccharospirillaceae bacterium]